MSDRERLAYLRKSTNQWQVIVKLAKESHWSRGAEIGVLRGKTLFNILDSCKNLHMIGVDQWRALPLRNVECAETYNDYDMAALEKSVLLKAKTYGGRCVILKGDSVSAAIAVEDGSLDFVFIDADHTLAGVERDIKAWAPKVRKGGMVLGHDNHWPTVRAVVSAYEPNWQDYGEAVWGVKV